MEYLEINIDGNQLDIKSIEELPILITYKLEDIPNFSTKTGTSSLNIAVPATQQNNRTANSYSNPSIEDLTGNQLYRGTRKAFIKAGGQELLVGKAFLKHAAHMSKPTGYEFDFYGNNSDWILDLQLKTLYDFVKHITFTFTKNNIMNSWNFDGMDENLPYVFAPVRYGRAMDSAISHVDHENIVHDYNMLPEYMKPSLSKYWILYWGFKSLGYRIESQFMDSTYFRRQVMPWTWGSFLFSDDTTQNNLRFLAKSVQNTHTHDNYGDFIDTTCSNDYYNGGFDNNNSYHYDQAGKEMIWTYLPTFSLGSIQATFLMILNYDIIVVGGGSALAQIHWYVTHLGIKTEVAIDNIYLFATFSAQHETNPALSIFQSFSVVPGDIVSAKIYVELNRSNFLSSLKSDILIEQFDLEYIRINLGGTIDFRTYLGFKNYNFLDLLAGIVDEFDLTIQTDSIQKVVYIEPTHAYAFGNDLSNTFGGYFNGKMLDWSDKQDLSKESTIESFTDSERELLFSYKNDSADGSLKNFQDKNKVIVSQARYLFPERFMVGRKEILNRFFAPTMHYVVKQWDQPPRKAPQMIIMAPENISNTSKDSAQNTFIPKSVFYKGLNYSYNWIFDNQDFYGYPEMFGVNYMPGGESDPVLSYSDETIGTATGKGLLRRFFLQRLAIMTNGQYYTTWFNLNNRDIANFLHREYVLCRGQKWEVIQIIYNPVKNQSSQVIMRKHVHL